MSWAPSDTPATVERYYPTAMVAFDRDVASSVDARYSMFPKFYCPRFDVPAPFSLHTVRRLRCYVDHTTRCFAYYEEEERWKEISR